MIHMTNATVTGRATQDVTYNWPVAAASLTADAFTSNPSGEPASEALNEFANVITLFFGGDVSADTSLTYTGSTPGLLTPQTIPLT